MIKLNLYARYDMVQFIRIMVKILIIFTPAFIYFRHSKDINYSKYMLSIGITSWSTIANLAIDTVMVIHIGPIVQVLILNGYCIEHLIFNTNAKRHDKVNTLCNDRFDRNIQQRIDGIGSKTKSNGKERRQF